MAKTNWTRDRQGQSKFLEGVKEINERDMMLKLKRRGQHDRSKSEGGTHGKGKAEKFKLKKGAGGGCSK